MANNYNANQQQTTLTKITKQQPTPILKSKMVHPTNNNNTYTHSTTSNASASSSRKRAHSSSVEFSQEISIMERKATIESEEIVESGKYLLLYIMSVHRYVYIYG